MSSLHQDRLVAEGSEPVEGSRPTLAPVPGTSRRIAGTAEDTVPNEVPTPRRGKPRTTTTPTTSTPRRGTGATGKTPAESAKAPPAKAATRRPTPYKRTPGEAVALVLAETADPAELTDAAETQARDAVTESTPVVGATAPEQTTPEDLVAAVAHGRCHLVVRRLPAGRRRPTLYLAAALAGALGLSLTPADPPAQAQTHTVSHSVSVAEQLGIAQQARAIEEITPEAANERLEELAVSRNERLAEQTEAAEVQRAAEAARPKAVLPVAGARLTSGFGTRWGTLHAGIDLAAPMMTPEYAAMDGVVLEAGPASGFGNAVYIQHENGDVTVYGHMEQVLVSAGQVVKAGDTIALLGNRGQSTGPHLHFEVHVGGIDGTKIDPIPWLRERGVSI